ncbi:hypothetical protein CEXT_17941 [Caerostris extrusa]|uniref:Uncharacterized protein n=1 Tax=Caerostris extrusa TaxID=172846 RepID=A0AAV4UJU0_CAEEX|nr:hypothetical protein CEXT_17941 [Caerostris extrusa]
MYTNETGCRMWAKWFKALEAKEVNPHLSLLKVSHQSINIITVTVKVSKSTQLVPGQSRDECDDCELPRRLKPIERTRYV